MKEYYVLVVEWKKILPDSPGMLEPDEMLTLVTTNNTPQIITSKFYNEELFIKYYASLLNLKDYSSGFNMQKLERIDDYHFLVFNTLEELEFYQEQKQNVSSWIQYVADRDNVATLLGIEPVTHSTRYKITVEDKNFDTALIELVTNIKLGTA
jgi:hypothetical protein